MENKKHLVIGAGEVGTSIFNVLKEYYETAIRDVEGEADIEPDVLHICYPPKKNFVEETKKYIEKYSPELVIIHSTIRPGTTKEVGGIAVHSPIRGVHPKLEDGIKTFVKYFGGEKAKEAAEIFENIGIKTEVFEKPETTELAKILDTTYYAWNIVFQKEVKRICDEMDLDFDEVYTTPNRDYNEGYKKLGMEHVVRPVLKDFPGPIRGHCLIPNCDLLDDWVTEVIKERNRRWKLVKRK